jgi:EAL domain-containing protein (putative c-di-GMP-specific phosphodiesterase class I)
MIAKGVGAEKQRCLLDSFGCDYAEGWLYSNAVTGEDVEIILQKQTDATLPVSGAALTRTG